MKKMNTEKKRASFISVFKVKVKVIEPSRSMYDIHKSAVMPIKFESDSLKLILSEILKVKK